MVKPAGRQITLTLDELLAIGKVKSGAELARKLKQLKTRKRKKRKEQID